MNNKRFLAAIVVLCCWATVLQGKKASFKVQIRNEGAMFEEVVDIDVKRKTETFYIPLQGDFEEAEIINDFRKNLTMISLPKRQVCYVSQLIDKLPRPLKLIRSFRKAATEVSNGSQLERVTTTMETNGLIDDLSSLSNAMRKLCQSFPIYRIEPAEDTISITAVTSGDQISGDSGNRVCRGHCSSNVCYTIQVCYLTCASSACIVCTEVHTCRRIDC